MNKQKNYTQHTSNQRDATRSQSTDNYYCYYYYYYYREFFGAVQQ